MLLFYLFASEDPTQTSYRKRPLIEGDEPVDRNVCAKVSANEKFKLALMSSRHKKEMKVARKLDRARGIGPFG